MLGNRAVLERELLTEIAVERPRSGPEDRPLSGAERLVAIGDVARRDLALVEEIEHPFHRRDAGLGIDGRLLEIVEARWKPICAATMPQVTVGCTPDPVIMMPERTTLSPSRRVSAFAHSIERRHPPGTCRDRARLP